MSNRWLRFVIAILAIGAAGAAGYRIFQQEQRLAADLNSARNTDMAAEAALITISELKAAMHAYVAEGQGDAFWTARAGTLVDRLRAATLELEPAASAAGATLTETLDLTDRLAAAEQRAREHLRAGQRLLAGEVIFTDARDLLDGMRLQIAGARRAVAETAGRTHAEIRREQAMLALGAAGILAFATLLLVIPGGAAAGTAATVPAATTAKTERDEPAARVTSRASIAPRTTASPGAPTVSTPARDVAPAAPVVSTVSLREAAAVCTELGRVSQSIEISALLERGAKVLNASGAIVWMASSDAREMYPAVSAGYDERLITRIGAIKRDANNVTAAAFRDATPRTSTALAASAAALAVPLMTPLGPVGVFSAEIRDVTSVDESRLAVATIFAAQLATLLGSMPAPAIASDDTAEPAQAKAQA
jgi:hypothetical protein